MAAVTTVTDICKHPPVMAPATTVTETETSRSSTTVTPTKGPKRLRPLIHTPTPRKPKRADLQSDRNVPPTTLKKVLFAPQTSKVSFRTSTPAVVTSVVRHSPLMAAAAATTVTETSSTTVTPTKGPKRLRPLIHTPTPRKPKRAALQSDRNVPPTLKKVLFAPQTLKVSFRTSTPAVVTRVVRDTDMKGIIKCIVHGENKGKVAKKIYKSCPEDIHKEVLLQLHKECRTLCKTTTRSMLRDIRPDNLAAFSFNALNVHISMQAPLVHSVMRTFCKNREERVAATSAIVLQAHNKHMSAFHHIVGQTLDHGGATDETIHILNHLGLCVSPTAVASKRKELQTRQQLHVERLVLEEPRRLEEIHKTEPAGNEKHHVSASYDILGDNIDITRNPSRMTKQNRTKSWHWFLLVGSKKRVTFPLLSDIPPPASDITSTESSTFVPSAEDCSSLDENFIYHIMHCLVKHVKCFQKYSKCLPKYIPHPHVEKTSLKTDYAILDLLDKSENKAADMICILEHIHKEYIAHSADKHPELIQRTVFGGDVLTNERAFVGQMSLLNGETDYECLTGVIHRPEGLHRMMNLLLLIYEQFYKQSSAHDVGTLSQLRNVVGRVNVQGASEVIGKYRSHFAFVEDCLDAFIVAASMDLLKMEKLETEPQRHQVLFDALSADDQLKYIQQIAREILDSYVKVSTDVEELQARSEALDQQDGDLKDMFDSTTRRYTCRYCDKVYKTLGPFKKHLASLHDIPIITEEEHSASIDHISAYRSSFMKCALLLRDTQDAYTMGDGGRIMCNTKFQMLLSDVGHHTKYKIWLFRYLAYYYALLSPRLASEYKWNCTTNLKGKRATNIPNDNLVELLVQTVKKKIHSQGANATFESARTAALTVQIQDEIRTNIQVECGSWKKGSSRSTPQTTGDIAVMIEELRIAKVFDSVPRREFAAFSKFRDLFSRVKIVALHKWINKQKEDLLLEEV